MSRCFPFPPPGYKLNGIRDEAALIESIKVADEKAKKEQKRKERKREKKEKKEKEKKRKEREIKEGESEKHSHKRRRKEEKEGTKDGQNNQKVDPFPHKLKENQIDYLEKSTLTVERELVQSTSQNSCDSTLNSNEIPKQKQPLDGSRHNSNEIPKEKLRQPLDGRHNNNNNNNNDSESIIRIRLPIRRQKDPEVMLMTNKDQQKPGGIKLDSFSQPAPITQLHPCSTSAPDHTSKLHEEKKIDVTFTTKLGKEKISSSVPDHTSKPLEEKEKRKDPTKLGKEKKRSSSLSTSQETTYQPSRLCSICPPSMVLQFLNVVENWVPNTIERRIEELTNSEEDEECWWLLKKTTSSTERCNQVNINSNDTKQVISGSIAWPCARLLPEADVHALPYTVPF